MVDASDFSAINIQTCVVTFTLIYMKTLQFLVKVYSVTEWHLFSSGIVEG